MRIENPIPEIPFGGAATSAAHKSAPLPPQVSAPAASELPDVVVSALKRDLSSIQFAIENDSSTHEIVVKMVDQSTGEVVRQIPSEEILRTARAITEMMAAQQKRINARG
ncbi:MAG: flagellar protein FlaG [Acidobacteria bacterium]|nr:flagellar protein FlaG [Acidobacteriota bacterium]